MAKKCTKCGGPGPFHKNKASPDGLHPWCKSCRHSSYMSRQEAYVAASRSRYAANSDGIREHNSSPERRAVRAATMCLYRARNTDKVRARNLLNSAIRAGNIKRQPCEKCGCKRTSAHHADYSKPLEVQWLCIKCHGIAHRIGD